MKGLFAALRMEGLKVRRSKVFMATMSVFAFVAVMMGLLVFVTMHPEFAGKSVVLSAKASIIGKADWPSYFGLLNQLILTAGTMGFGFVVSWVFGREYSDRVVKDLLALPISRLTIVLAKFIIVMIWNLLLALIVFFIALLSGLAVNISGWSAETAYGAFLVFTGSSLLTILLCTPVAFIASFGRGYLLPIGFVILILFLTQLVFVGVPGITPYFPWAVPALTSGIAGPELPQAGAISYLILALTSFMGLFATAAWWRFADQT